MQKRDVQREQRVDTTQVVAFRLGSEIYGIEILFIQEVLHLQKITVLPNAPAFIQGVIELRGNVIPIIDLRKRLNLPDGDAQRRRIIVVDLEQGLLGLLVDDVYKVLRVDPRNREEVPAAVVSESARNCVSHLIKTDSDGLVILIAPRNILSSSEHNSLQAFESAHADAAAGEAPERP